MSHRPKAIQYIRADGFAVICCYCEGKKEADEWAENNHYESTHGICAKCIDKFKFDSIRKSDLAIKH